MTDREIMQQALDALEHIIYWDNEKPEWEYAHAAITVLRSRLAQPEQKPVAVWELQEDGWKTICDGDWLQTLPVGTKLYTTPPQREWVGLTNEEIDYLYVEHRGDGGPTAICEQFAKAYEACLKEKNT